MPPPSPWEDPSPRPSRREPSRGPRWGRLFFFLIGFGLLVVVLDGLTDGQARDGVLEPGFVYSLLFLLTIGASWVLFSQSRLRTLFRNALIWFCIVSIITIGYAFRHDLEYLGSRITASLLPGRGYEQGQAMVFERGPGGHFWVEAEIAGTPILFLVDTGATKVVLNQADARRLGLRLNRSDYVERYSTANGTMAAAPVRLSVVQLGSISVRDVSASVTAGQLQQSLLGMSFLSELNSFTIQGDRLILEP